MKLFIKVKKFFGSKEEGATRVEDGILVVLIAAVCIGQRLAQAMVDEQNYPPP
jgi:Flp pilus assembly pilin Flp